MPQQPLAKSMVPYQLICASDDNLMGDFVFLMVLIIVLWFWWDSIGAKELAREAGQRTCKQSNVQFLDDTVAITQVWLRRDVNGKLKILREYRFDFSSDGIQRFQGCVRLLGKNVKHVELSVYRI